MAVSIHRDLDAGVSRLVFHVNDRRSILDEQGAERVPQIGQANLTDSGLADSAFYCEITTTCEEVPG